MPNPHDADSLVVDLKQVATCGACVPAREREGGRRGERKMKGQGERGRERESSRLETSLHTALIGRWGNEENRTIVASKIKMWNCWLIIAQD